MNEYTYNGSVRIRKPKKNVWLRPLDEPEAVIVRKMYKTLLENGILSGKAIKWLASCFTVEEDNIQTCITTQDQQTYLRAFNNSDSTDSEEEGNNDKRIQKKKYKVPSPKVDARGWGK